MQTLGMDKFSENMINAKIAGIKKPKKKAKAVARFKLVIPKYKESLMNLKEADKRHRLKNQSNSIYGVWQWHCIG